MAISCPASDFILLGFKSPLPVSQGSCILAYHAQCYGPLHLVKALPAVYNVDIYLMLLKAVAPSVV